MAGRTRRAQPGEPTCSHGRCPRPAGLGTNHPGRGPCLRHGGAFWREPLPIDPVKPLVPGELPTTDPVAKRLTGKGEPAANPRAFMGALLTTAARGGFPFELAWRLAAPSALSYMTEDDAHALWADLQAEQPKWQAWYARLLNDPTTNGAARVAS